MNTKQRNVVYQRWTGVIRRETRDLASLEQIGARALADRDVRDDSTLQSMIRTDLQHRRDELEQELQMEQLQFASSKTQAVDSSVPPEPLPEKPPPDQIREAFGGLTQTLCDSLERGDEEETRAAFEKMRSLQEQNPSVIPAAIIGNYEQRVKKLRVHIQQLTDEIGALKKNAVKASHDGSKQDLARSLRRLTAIHAAHPRLLDESELEDVRRSVADAVRERRQNQLTTKKLLARERTIAAEIKALAAAVRAFHQVAIAVPDTSEEFHKAEAIYLRAMQTCTNDTEWFPGVVLDMADLLAEWTVPPLGAEGHIDRFLDSISTGLERIRAEMRQITSEQIPRNGHGSEAEAP